MNRYTLKKIKPCRRCKKTPKLLLKAGIDKDGFYINSYITCCGKVFNDKNDIEKTIDDWNKS